MKIFDINICIVLPSGEEVEVKNEIKIFVGETITLKFNEQVSVWGTEGVLIGKSPAGCTVKVLTPGHHKIMAKHGKRHKTIEVFCTKKVDTTAISLNVSYSKQAQAAS